MSRSIRTRTAFAGAISTLLSTNGLAQSLYQAPIPQPPPSGLENTPPGAPTVSEHGHARGSHDPMPPQPAPASVQDPRPAAPGVSAALSLEQVSTFAVQPMKPKVHAKHDKVEIVINETSLQKHEQTMDTKENSSLSAELSKFPSFKNLLLDATLTQGIGEIKPSVGFTNNDTYKGSGAYERKDRFTARVSALVIDVKPNGMLVIEARETIQSDEEIKTMVVSGLADPKDITAQNTVQSTQLANLVIRVEHEGQVKNAAEKGFVPRLFETLFGF